MRATPTPEPVEPPADVEIVANRWSVRYRGVRVGYVVSDGDSYQARTLGALTPWESVPTFAGAVRILIKAATS